MYKITYSEDTLYDLREIADYISLDNPFYAKKVITKIYKSIEFLETYPFIWKPRHDELRELVEPQYKFRIFYKVEDKNIYIISIFKYKNNWN